MNSDTRNRILMTAMELFWEKGYNSTSVSDILSRSQIHSGSLYPNRSARPPDCPELRKSVFRVCSGSRLAIYL